jgi:xylulokinase
MSNAKTPAVLGVDVGTSSTKGVLVGFEGTILASTVREHTVDQPGPGKFEMSAEVWWDEFCQIASELVEPADVAVHSIGVSGMGPCGVLTDESGTPVRPAILYGIDTRAETQIDNLTRELGDDAILDRCGSVLTTQAAGPKIAWVRQEEPDTYARARRLYMPASYLAMRLTGAYVLDHHSASQSTPLYDTRELAWYEPWADEIAPGLELPELAWPGEQSGTVTHDAANELSGIDPGTPVITGTIDSWSEAIGADAQHPGDLMLMYGTTMFLVATTEQRTESRTMWGTVGARQGTYNLAGGMATSGAVTSWLRDLTGGAPYPDLMKEARASGAGARGLVMLPYFAGERTPIQDPAARGVIAGLTLDHGRGDCYRAALEATAFGVRHNVEELHRSGASIDRVVAAGGGTQGDLWPQIVTDITGLDQVIPTNTIGASYGAALLAAELVSDTDTSTWNPPAQHLAPDPSVRDRYDELYGLYRDLYTSTRHVMHTLARIQTGPPSSTAP